MASHQTHSWPSVVAFYQASAGSGLRFAAMADLAERIAHSPYAAALHPVTSHYLLRLFAHEQFDFHDDQIQVEHDGDAFEVRYFAAMGRRNALGPVQSTWHKRSTDGFDALERCVDYLGWFVAADSRASRPAG